MDYFSRELIDILTPAVERRVGYAVARNVPDIVRDLERGIRESAGMQNELPVTIPAELEGKVAKVAACIQTEVARVALAETGLLRYELYCFALKHGITDPEELVELARAAMTSPDRHDYSVVPPMPPTRWQFGKVHPGTFSRAMNRYLGAVSRSQPLIGCQSLG